MNVIEYTVGQRVRIDEPFIDNARGTVRSLTGCDDNPQHGDTHVGVEVDGDDYLSCVPRAILQPLLGEEVAR